MTMRTLWQQPEFRNLATAMRFVMIVLCSEILVWLVKVGAHVCLRLDLRNRKRWSLIMATFAVCTIHNGANARKVRKADRHNCDIFGCYGGSKDGYPANLKPLDVSNTSVDNTTLYLYTKILYFVRATCFDLVRSSSGPPRRQSQEMFTFHCIVGFQLLTSFC